MGLRIGLTYNLKRKGIEGYPEDFFSEFDGPETIEQLKCALEALGHEVFLVEANKELVQWFSTNKVDIVFNIAEGVIGEGREAQVPAVLDFLSIPYTGSGILTMALSLNKAYSKRVFFYENIPTPKFHIYHSVQQIKDVNLKFPLIVKPNCEGSAKGISSTSVVLDITRLRQEVEQTILKYKQDALVEEFIEGRELTVGILGNKELKVLPVLEIDFSSCKGSGEYFYSWRMKEYQGDATLKLTPTFYCPARLKAEEYETVCAIAKKTYRALGCLDFARIDFRLATDGTPYVLEVNPLPGLDPKESNLTFMAGKTNISYTELIKIILESALMRYNINNSGAASLKIQGGKIATRW